MKRYDLVTNYRAGSSIEEMEPADDGEWVRFDDVPLAELVEALALRHHKEIEGEYGCGYPQTKCPGVLRLMERIGVALKGTALPAPHPDEREMFLRKGLWINHGCTAAMLYGDDGEMQCSACGLDFKRGSLADLCSDLIALGRLHAGKVPAPHGWQPMGKGWNVRVERFGDLVVSIGERDLAGRDITEEDAALIRGCAQHLLSFVGDPPPVPGCPPEKEQE